MSVSLQIRLSKPGFHFVDVPEVFSVTRQKGAFVNYQARDTGVVVKNPEDIVVAITTELADPGCRLAERRRCASDLFYSPGKATDAITAWFYAEFWVKRLVLQHESTYCMVFAGCP